MPHSRECARNRFTLQETNAYLRKLGYRGSFDAVRHRSCDVRREGLPESQFFILRKDVCHLLWQWPATRPGDTIDVSCLLFRYGDLDIPFCFIQGFQEAIREREAEHILSLITVINAVKMVLPHFWWNPSSGISSLKGLKGFTMLNKFFQN